MVKKTPWRDLDYSWALKEWWIKSSDGAFQIGNGVEGRVKEKERKSWTDTKGNSFHFPLYPLSKSILCFCVAGASKNFMPWDFSQAAIQLLKSQWSFTSSPKQLEGVTEWKEPGQWLEIILKCGLSPYCSWIQNLKNINKKTHTHINNRAIS